MKLPAKEVHMTDKSVRKIESRLPGLGALVVVLFVFAGCASHVTSDVTRFHELSGVVVGTARIVPANPENENSLEFESYAALIGAELGRLGFSPPEADQPGSSSSDFVVEVDYSVSDSPAGGIYNPRFSMSYGYGYHPYYGYRGRHYGRYGAFGFGYGYPAGYAYAREAYMRHLDISITRTSDGKRIFEGQVDSRGRISSIAEIMPYMVLAMFEGYPGVSGKTHRVAVSIDTLEDRAD